MLPQEELHHGGAVTRISYAKEKVIQAATIPTTKLKKKLYVLHKEE